MESKGKCYAIGMDFTEQDIDDIYLAIAVLKNDRDERHEQGKHGTAAQCDQALNIVSKVASAMQRTMFTTPPNPDSVINAPTMLAAEMRAEMSDPDAPIDYWPSRRPYYT